MRAGDLDERISIRRRTRTQNEYGTLVAVDSVVADTWARVTPKSGGESDEGQQTEARTMYEVEIRYRSGILESDHIVWRGAELNIRSILDGGPRAVSLVIGAERGAP